MTFDDLMAAAEVPAEPPGRPGRGSARGPMGIVALAWGLVVVVVFLQFWLATWLWFFVLVVDVLAAVVVLCLVLPAAATLAYRRRYLLSVTSVTVTLALIVSFGSVDWRPLYAYGWYALNWPAFAQVAELARDDRLARVERPAAGTYDLPGTLGIVSVDGRVSWCGQSEGELVLLAPALLSTPDGGAGFVHVVGSRPDSTPDWRCNANGDQVRPRYRLGGGWWWAD